MNIKNIHFNKHCGSALILVVVVTVLLAVVGVMFMMVSRVSEMETTAVADQRDLEAAVDTVVARIDEVLVEDLFGANGTLFDSDGSDESYDIADTADEWLASLEPDTSYNWTHITDLYGASATVPGWTTSVGSNVVLDNVIAAEAGDADADGDGVADSRWVKVPGMTSSRGRDVYAAIRIIDNCAMLNLNAATLLYQEPYDGTSPFFDDGSSNPVSLFEKPWFSDELEYDNFVQDCNNLGLSTARQHLYHKDLSTGSGRYLTEINYLPFLRGSDLNTDFFTTDASNEDWTNLMEGRGFWDSSTSIPFTPQEVSDVLMYPDMMDGIQLFDIGDELEIRNRYLVTSLVEARFEQDDAANFSLDSGGGAFSALSVPRDSSNAISLWEDRINPANFDAWSGAVSGDEYVYDRRHVCTFYSYDRIFRQAQYSVDYPLLNADISAYALANYAAEGYATASEYEDYLLDLWESFFVPVGPVTTDIRVPVEVSAGTWTYYNSTETRKRIVQLLYAFREYFYNINGNNLTNAAQSAAQVVANLIDYSDDDAIFTTSNDLQGPFYDAQYGDQANVDCTFITETIIEDMVDEVSGGLIVSGTLTFGLGTNVVFGYEKQPFISEVYAYRNPSSGGVLEGFAVELVNPYSDNIKLYRDDGSYTFDVDNWRIKVGDGSVIDYIIGDVSKYVPMYDTTYNSPGRYIIRSSFSVGLATGPLGSLTYELSGLLQINSLANKEIQILRPAPKWVVDNLGIGYIVVDRVTNAEVTSLLALENRSALKRDDTKWKFIYSSNYDLQQDDVGTYAHTLGQANNVTIAGLSDGFQIGASDDQQPLVRWHDMEVLGLYGNTNNAADVVTDKLFNEMTAGNVLHFDLTGTTDNPSDYIATINRPDSGTLPGRINVNNAPAVVIAAAIPPTLADPDNADPAVTPVTFSALDLADQIVANRPYTSLSDLLTNVPRMKQYTTGGALVTENVGTQSIEDDIEEEHWVLSNLANKLTVRSDVFTAYILVRLGENGPQRRMLAIFDRSDVWDANDRPKLVALHPVPDPR